MLQKSEKSTSDVIKYAVLLLMGCLFIFILAVSCYAFCYNSFVNFIKKKMASRTELFPEVEFSGKDTDDDKIDVSSSIIKSSTRSKNLTLLQGPASNRQH